MKAMIVLEDGTAFEGNSFGAEGEKTGEVIFNTQITGWQEMLTEPANLGKIIVIGYPHVGNYGINDRSFESQTAHAQALVVKEYSKIYSNWQAKGPLDEFMKKHNVLGIEGIDTRALTLHIRDNGEMRGIVSTGSLDIEDLMEKIKGQAALKFQIPSTKSQTIPKSQGSKSKTVIIDIGVNNSTLAKYPDAAVVAHHITAEKVLALKPEQVVISSGPGDPRKLEGLVEEVKRMIGKVKLYGIQNGACVLALALGGSVVKMKVGHHGMNQPVVDPKTGKGEITMQNHSFGIGEMGSGIRVIHKNLNDGTIEAFKTKDGECVGTLYFPIDERGKLAPGYQYV